MKSSTLLKQSMKYLWDGKGDYGDIRDDTNLTRNICITMELFAESRERDHGYEDALWDKIYDIQALIEGRLGGTQYEEWLLKEGFLTKDQWIVRYGSYYDLPDFYRYIDYSGDFQPEFEALTKKIQLSRKEWMKALIAEFKAKGD